MSDQKRKLETIFHVARELSDLAQREIYIHDACQGDPALLAKVEGLLRASAEAESVFAESNTAPEAQATIKLNLPLEEPAGTVVGRYKLLQKIGEGGMGVVYMAEQTEPVTRKVALKIIKLGMDTKQVVARFEAERQALAMMDHPNIAKVLDAGATDTGRPYFVMDLVRGVPITEYCDKNKLSTQQRLQLFIPVCQAIQHAHQKGVIHRDIKPSNVMVTLNDGVPHPMVIDFGIAKATNQKLTEKTLFTNYAQMIGTPAYMSPEQAEMSKLDVDTRTDVYSLGVLLYELLTGTTPFPSKELLSLGYGEMQRFIVEKEPPKPSTRLSTMQNEERTAVAKNRSVEANALGKAFKGDLDWIVMKALEKDRTHRYETVNGLVADVQRHLNNDPVSAAAPSLAYQLSRLYRKHRRAFAGAGAVAVALLAGLIVAWWQAARATANERKARLEAAKSERVARFVKDTLNSLGLSSGHAWVHGVPIMRETLDEAARRIDEDFEGQPDVEAELRTTLGVIYNELSDSRKAEPMLRKALTLRRTLPPRPPNSIHVSEKARQRPPIRSSWQGDEDPTLAASLFNLGQCLSSQGKREAKALFEEALAINRHLLGNESPKVANCLEHLGMEALGEGKIAEAEKMENEALAIRRKQFGNEHWDVASSLMNVARVHEKKGELPEAANTMREALVLNRKFYGENHFEVIMSSLMLASFLTTQGTQENLLEAEQLYRAVLPSLIRLIGRDDRMTRDLIEKLASILRQQGKDAEAEALLNEQTVDNETK